MIETHGIVDGIYRLSGITSNIQKLRNEFDEEGEPELNTEVYLQDIHSISSLLKMYFRELPNPLLTYQLYDPLTEAVQSGEDSTRLMRVHDIIQQLPPPHYRYVILAFQEFFNHTIVCFLDTGIIRPAQMLWVLSYKINNYLTL